MLKVQQFLLNHSLEDLEKEHGVYSRFSNTNPKKFTLNYDQFEFLKGDEVAEECRGLVLELIDFKSNPGKDIVIGETKVLAYPFRKFYNEGEYEGQKQIDWNSATAFLKLDGTLCIVYWDETLIEWCVATRSVPDADVPFEAITNKTFSQLFKQAAFETYLKAENGVWDDNPETFFDLWLDRDKTYMFELCTPENQIVVRHEDYKIWLIGMRDNSSYQEINILSPEIKRRFEVCPTYDLSNLNDLISFIAEKDASKFEGVVVRDKNFNRVKIKHKEYGALNSARDRFHKSPRASLEAILMEKEDDIRPLLPPELQRHLDTTKEAYACWLERVEAEYRWLFNPDRKQFAIAVQTAGAPIGPHMFVWSQKGSFKDWTGSHKNNDGTFPDKFIDNLLEMINK